MSEVKNATQANLDACPFCGHGDQVSLTRDIRDWYASVRCDRCNVGMDESTDGFTNASMDEAERTVKERWNRRPVWD